jgi:phenylpropionate dioxygenase-like ring-hydroxylating dioxygenase large terminal subunit
MTTGKPYSTSLTQEQYLSESIYREELDKVFGRQWLLAGHVSQVKAAGDFFVKQIGPESLIIVRDTDGRVRAFFNVCRHRGFRICGPNQHGKAGRFTCPYHAWTYGTDGRLLAAPGARDGVDLSFDDWKLHEAWCDVAYGFVLVCLSRRKPTPAHEAITLRGKEGDLAALQPERMALAHRETYVINANWKTVVENDSECYHCATAHPSLSVSCNYRGFFADSRSGEHFPLNAGMKTFSMDGDWVCTKQLGTPQGERFSTGFLLMPLFSGPVFFADYCISFETTPLAVDKTQLICEWFVHEDAVEGVHYDRRKLIEVFHVTNQEDVQLMERNYAGVQSMRYSPGPLSATREDFVIAALDLYREMMAQESTPIQTSYAQACGDPSAPVGVSK